MDILREDMKKYLNMWADKLTTHDLIRMTFIVHEYSSRTIFPEIDEPNNIAYAAKAKTILLMSDKEIEDLWFWSGGYIMPDDPDDIEE